MAVIAGRSLSLLVRFAAPLAAAIWITAPAAARNPSAGAGEVRLVYAVASRLDFNRKTSSIWVARADGSDPVRLTQGLDPLLSPDGRWIAFDRVRRTARELMVISSAGGPVRTLTTVRVRPGHGPLLAPETWAPNSRTLAFAQWSGHSGDLALVDTRTGRVTVIARTDNVSGADDAAFSPDGSHVAFTALDSTGADIDVYERHTHRTMQLTHDHRAFGPVWGPHWIAYAELRKAGTGDVWLMRPGGDDKHQLTRTRAGLNPFAWSANGQRLLAYYPPSHNGRLWAVDVPSGKAVPLTPMLGDLYPQGLAEDGTTVLAAIGCGGTPSPVGILETLPFSGGQPTVIAHGPCRGSWNR